MKLKIVTIAVSLLLIKSLNAQWSSDPTLNTPISIAERNQFLPNMISDGEGGAFITWYDYRSNNIAAIYAQRINTEGSALWTENGVLISPSNFNQTYPALVGDGNGGAYICWWDGRNIPNNSMYIQKINYDGIKQWQEDIKIAELTGFYGTYNSPKIKSDHLGGAVITWESDNSNIIAQRINSDGSLLWGVNGLTVVNDDAVQTIPDLICDEVGNSIITWLDHRNSSPDVYIQKIGPDGTFQWLANGIQLTDVNGYQTNPVLTSNGANGAIVTWVDYRNGISPDIYAQKISSTGITEWEQNGVEVCVYDTIQTNPLITSNQDGVYICWNDYRNGYSDLFIQKLDMNGNKLWANNGVTATSNSGNKEFQSMIINSNGNLVVTWTDSRNGTLNQDIYAQALNVNGGLLWDQQGIPVCTANNSQVKSKVIESLNGSSIIVWYDGRSIQNFDIYAQKVLSDGTLGNPTNVENDKIDLIKYELHQNFPNPFNPSTKISWQAPISSHQTLKVYDVLGKEVTALVDEYLPAGSYEVEFNANQLSSGVYFYSLKVSSFVETKKLIVIK